MTGSSHSIMLLCDSAMGTALPATQFPDGLGPWWAASAVISHPELVRTVHQQNVEAGSDVILTATYQAYSSIPETPLVSLSNSPCLSVCSYEESSLRDVCTKAIQLARSSLPTGHVEARSSSMPRIGLSVGPIGSALPGGLEFTGAYTVDRHSTRQFYLPKLSSLMAAWCETEEHNNTGTQLMREGLVVFETFPRLDEAVFVLNLFEELAAAAAVSDSMGVRWACTISFVVHDGEHLPCGASIGTLLSALEPFLQRGTLIGVGCNCSYSLSAEEAVMKMLSTTTTTKVRQGSNSIGSPSSPCYLVWKPNASPAALPPSHQHRAADVLDDFKASTRRVAEQVVMNHCHNRNQQQGGSDDGQLLFRFDKLLCGGCCGTTAEEIRWLAELRSNLMNSLGDTK